jgi:CheY-like chemotaxis protein
MYLKPLHLPKARIQVLEQDPILRAGLCSLLTDAGYSLAEAATRAIPVGEIDLVLASFSARQTPKAALCLADRAAPVILLVDRAAWLGFDFFDVANDLGAVAVLQRPFSRSALLRLVAKVLSAPAHGAVVAEADENDSPSGLAEILLRLENPNFA